MIGAHSILNLFSNTIEADVLALYEDLKNGILACGYDKETTEKLLEVLVSNFDKEQKQFIN